MGGSEWDNNIYLLNISREWAVLIPLCARGREESCDNSFCGDAMKQDPECVDGCFVTTAAPTDSHLRIVTSN